MSKSTKKSAKSKKALPLPKELLLRMHSLMLKSRVLEERLIKIYKAGEAFLTYVLRNGLIVFIFQSFSIDSMLLSRARWRNMKSVAQFRESSIHVVLTDIDGTLTQHGRLPPQSYSSLWNLAEAGLKVIPVTGRAAGWCELIARLWPVHGVVGENGAFYFRMKNGRMTRHWMFTREQRRAVREKMRTIRSEITKQVPGCKIASDQFARLFDLAVDFAEDVPPMPMTEVKKIVDVFHSYGANAKISNIHVNGWFGDHNKLSTCKEYLRTEFGFNENQMRAQCVFVGDSPNDEPMFEFFPNSFAVANIKRFLTELKTQPAYVTEHDEANGFVEVSERLLALQG